MTYKAAIAAAVLAVIGAPLAAQGVTGGQIGVEYQAPLDGEDFGGTTYSGGIEYAITKSFSIGADLSSYRFDNLDESASSATVHGIYHLSDTASVGLFLGRDAVEDQTANLYGIEGGTELMGGTVEGYVGVGGDEQKVTFLGVDAIYNLQNGFALTGGGGYTSADDDSVTRIAVGGQYQMEGGPEFYAEVGNLTFDNGVNSDDELFIGIGARVAFGLTRGTTFDQRSAFEILPGF